MRHILLTLILLVPAALFGQGNLQFSKVKFITTTDTVPAGKVWKIEGVFYSGALPDFPTGLSSANSNSQILVNGNATVIRSARAVDGGSGGKAYSVWEQRFPLWMPQGTILATSSDVAGISIVEFGVTP